jgi:hypothetical protein
MSVFCVIRAGRAHGLRSRDLRLPPPGFSSSIDLGTPGRDIFQLRMRLQ